MKYLLVNSYQKTLTSNFSFTGAKAGDDIEITWKDLKGNSDTTVEKSNSFNYLILNKRRKMLIKIVKSTTVLALFISSLSAASFNSGAEKID